MAERKVGLSRFDWSQVRVGALALVALAILAYGVYRVGTIFDVFAERYTLVTPVESVAGLREGAAVTLAGQRVGQVDALEFIPVAEARDTNHIVMYLSIARGVQPQIRRDSRAFIRTQGIIGEKYVDISPGSPGSRVLDAGDTLPAAPTVDLDRILTMAAATLDTAQTVMSGLARLVGPLERGEGTLGRLLQDDVLYARLVNTTGELALLVHGLNEGQGTLGRLVRDPSLYTKMDSAVARLNGVTADLLNEEGSLGKLVRSDSLYQALLSSARSADSTLEALAATASMVAEGNGTLGQLVRDPSLYEAILKAVVDLQTVIQQIRQDPSAIRPEIKVDVF